MSRNEETESETPEKRKERKQTEKRHACDMISCDMSLHPKVTWSVVLFFAVEIAIFGIRPMY